FLWLLSAEHFRTNHPDVGGYLFERTLIVLCIRYQYLYNLLGICRDAYVLPYRFLVYLRKVRKSDQFASFEPSRGNDSVLSSSCDGLSDNLFFWYPRLLFLLPRICRYA